MHAPDRCPPFTVRCYDEFRRRTERMPTAHTHEQTRILVQAAAAACEDKKGEDIRILELDPVDSGLSDFFLVTSATNDRQAIAMADEVRYPAGGLTEQAVREIRRIKARVEAERIPRGADRALHVKLGPGGLSDVEWTIQLLQLQHAHAHPALRTTRTGAAMAAAVEGGLLTAGAATELTAAWQLAARIRNAIVLVGGRPGDTLPTRHARAVMDRLFYG